MTFFVDLSMYRGASPRSIGGITRMVEADTALDALCKAEQHQNVLVADDEYAAATAVHPAHHRHPAPASSMALAA